MRVVAFIWAYNEADIIGHTVRHLIQQGVHVHLLNNWSTDETEKIAGEVLDTHEWITGERWPMRGPVGTVSWAEMLEHTTKRAYEWSRQGSFWALHHDADEIRRSQTDGERLCDFFSRVGKAGWNAVDHHVVTYCPRDGYDPARHDPEDYFHLPMADHFDQRNGQIKAWYQTPDRIVDLASSGGHKAIFKGRKICPERLLLKHYPMRGEAQRAAKVTSRGERWDQQERDKGWHVAYVGYEGMRQFSDEY